MKVPRYLDEIDPKSLTDEQREKLRELYETDPYAFYNLWRDPAQAQIWAEGENFTTEPANDLFQKVGALKMAGAPEHVVEYWREKLEHRNRDEDVSDLFPPKTTPVLQKLEQIDELCEHLDSMLNWVENNLEPDAHEEDFSDDVPFAGKWLRLMQRAVGNLVTEHHNGTVRHYKEVDDAVQANMGVEVVEIMLNLDAKLELDLEDWGNSFIKPESCVISGTENGTRIRLEFFHCYE